MPADNTGVKTLVKRHWGGRAATFDDRPNHGLHSAAQRQAWQNLITRLAGPPPLQVLDVGCGTGFLSLLLAEQGHQVVGIDLAPEMLARARAKAEATGLTATFRPGDAESLDDPDGRYDLIVARHLIWTLPDPVRAIREWRRVLRPSGRVALIEGRWRNSAPGPEYEGIEDQLPFYGGRPAEELVAFLGEQELHTLTVQPLMDEVLWGGPVQHPRYLVTGTR